MSVVGRSLAGMEHYAIAIKGCGLEAHEALPGVHRVFALLHRGLLETHQGAVRCKHLDSYLREFEFRFNRRNSKCRGLLFQRLLSCAVQAKAPAYWKVVGRRAPDLPLTKLA